jgi:hypothetical protein
MRGTIDNNLAFMTALSQLGSRSRKALWHGDDGPNCRIQMHAVEKHSVLKLP